MTTQMNHAAQEKARFAGVEFVPQAILRVPLSYFADALAFEVEQSADDLDTYKGFAFVSEAAGGPVAVRHYAGHPEGTVTVYLPREVEDVPRITAVIGGLVGAFGLAQEQVIWQRRDNPGL